MVLVKRFMKFENKKQLITHMHKQTRTHSRKKREKKRKRNFSNFLGIDFWNTLSKGGKKTPFKSFTQMLIIVCISFYFCTHTHPSKSIVSTVCILHSIVYQCVRRRCNTCAHWTHAKAEMDSIIESTPHQLRWCCTQKWYDRRRATQLVDCPGQCSE